jgi:hypothetical protein
MTDHIVHDTPILYAWNAMVKQLNINHDRYDFGMWIGGESHELHTLDEWAEMYDAYLDAVQTAHDARAEAETQADALV